MPSKVSAYLLKQDMEIDVADYKSFLKSDFLGETPPMGEIKERKLNSNLLKGIKSGYKPVSGFIIEYSQNQTTPNWTNNLNAFSEDALVPNAGGTQSFFVIYTFKVKADKKLKKVTLGLSFGRGTTPIQMSLFEPDFGEKIYRAVGLKNFISASNSTVLRNSPVNISSKSAGSRAIPIDLVNNNSLQSILKKIETLYKHGATEIKIGGFKELAFYSGFKSIGTQLSALANFVKIYLDPNQKDQLGIDGLKSLANDRYTVADNPVITEFVKLCKARMEKKYVDLNDIDVIDNFDYEDRDEYTFVVKGLKNFKFSNINEIVGSEIISAFVDYQIKYNSTLDRNKLFNKLKSIKIDLGPHVHSLYQLLLYSNSSINNRIFLFEGKWYEVPVTAIQKIDRYINLVKVGINETDFLDFSQEDKIDPQKAENTYNKRMLKHNLKMKKNLILLDDPSKRFSLREKYAGTLGIATGNIEPCDLMTCYGDDHFEVVHVKRGKNGGNLSHCLGQLLTSMSLLQNSDSGLYEFINTNFEEESKHKVKGLAVPAELKQGALENKKFEFVCVLINQGILTSVHQLSILSQIQIAQTMEQVFRAGFQMRIVFVKDVS
ncbi:DUF6119 family protein [Lactiplantibacillus herbarum]|uniref:DUF6119 family protein n=1 Tax=Lactiplantibacillus herbarum TaxID=1670446 RepID=UPI00128CEB2A|nr:DUF6119 family protein [Lactiplantibacillus herbarum]